MKKLLFLTVLMAFGLTSFSQVNGDYRSQTTGAWSEITTWEVYDNGWVDATASPNQTSTVTILAAHTVSAEILLVDFTGTLTIDDGGTLDLSPSNPVLSSLEVSGAWIVNGTLQNSGAAFYSPFIISGSVTVGNTGDVTSEGNINVESGGTLTNNGSLVEVPIP